MRIQLEKYGCHIPKESRNKKWNQEKYYQTRFSCAVCEHCGAELYSEYLIFDKKKLENDEKICDRYSLEWHKLSDEKRKKNDRKKERIYKFSVWAENEVHTREERDLISDSNKLICPLCKKGIESIVYRDNEVLKDAFDKLNHIIEESDKKIAKENVDSLIEIFERESHGQSVLQESVEEIKRSPEKLKRFLEDLINIEMGIYTLSLHLKDLYPSFLQANRLVFQQKCAIEKKYSDEIKVIENNISILEDRILKTADLSVEDFSLIEPEKPVPPQEPLLQKPSIFNRKRVTEENARLMDEYDTAKKHYNSEYKEYKFKCAAVQLELSRQKNELKSHLSKEIEQNKAQLIELQSQYKEKVSKALLKPVPATEAKEEWGKEINTAKKILEKLIAARKTFYNCNVIYPSYQNLVASSRFYEYISSGRCSLLEGAHGAYNLYEEEVRAHLIICKLDEIIKELKAIRRNQYYLYSEFKKANTTLSSLNEKMEKVNNTLNRIESSTERIEYNTAATALYSQVNAELTNALGFLIALH